MTPFLKTVLDLCCGLGGWARGFLAEGWRVIGVDCQDFSQVYPGEFVQADILTWTGWRDLEVDLVVASPPCEEFSRWCMPWTRAKNPPPPDLRLWHRCEYIAKELKAPLIIENVRTARRWMGPSKNACGPFHLWGDVPAIVPQFQGKKKESYGSKQRAERAVIYEPLARHIARCFLRLDSRRREAKVIGDQSKTKSKKSEKK